MALDDPQGNQKASYACQPGPGNSWNQCPTPRLHARSAETLLVPFPLEYALYRIPVSPDRHSRASGNLELEVTFQYRQDHLETVLVRAVLRTVLTDEIISKVLAVVNDVQRYDEARQHSLTRQNLQEVREDPERFVLASGRAAESWEFPPEHRPQSLVLYRAMDRELTRPGCLSQAS